MRYSMVKTGSSISIPVTDKELTTKSCFTTLQARRSLHERTCTKALTIAQQDWVTHIGNFSAYLFPATENKTCGNWIALVMPNAIPFRLGLMTYAANMVFLHADIAHGAIADKAEDDLNTYFVGGLEAALPTDGSVSNEQQSSRVHSAVNGLLQPFAKALLDGDHTIATEVLHAWRRHYIKLSSIPSPEHVTTMNNFVCHRAASLGIEAWFTTLHYALGISLSAAELESAQPALDAATKSVAFTTDHHSWPKQSRAASNNERLDNVVAFAMTETTMSEQQAREHVKELAIGAEQGFRERRSEIKAEKGSELFIFLNAVEHFVAGNSLWCATCPRFHGY